MSENDHSTAGDQKKRKQRKAQTDEEYQAQKSQFERTGPQIHEEGWLLRDENIDGLEPERKIDRVQMLNACERAYFEQDYTRCLELVARAYALFGIQDEDTHELEREFESLGRKTRKSAKVERHVVDLGRIKSKCLQKLLS